MCLKKIKKYLPNVSNLKHYASTNIITNIMVMMKFGFWMGVWCSIVLQLNVERNQWRASRLPFKEYMKIHGVDTFWDTVAAILGVAATLVNALKWL